MSDPVETQAWHFTNGKTLHDGRPIPPVGEWLVHDGPLVPCERLLDALAFAPGGTLHRVTLRARERRIDWTLDAVDTERVLREFARWCARRVLHLWDAPDVVARYLETGDESLRDAARDAARYAARATARATAWDAAWDAGDAARYAAWAAARYAAWYAAWDAARATARATAGATAGATARATAGATARDAQNTELTRLVMAARNAPEAEHE